MTVNVNLVRDFLRENGLDALLDRTKCLVNRHEGYPNLVLLKYNMIDSPMDDPLVRSCRGIILDEADGWRVVCRPYDKFFNYGEGRAAEIDWETARVYEKLDGSLMTLYYYDGWQVSTTGYPDARGLVQKGNPLTFRDLFWRIWNQQRDPIYLLPRREIECCYMFEMMAPENRVVVAHHTPRLVLHGIRSVVTGKELPFAVFGKVRNWECAKTYNLNSLDDVISATAELQGIKNEGFVVCDANFNRVKVKSMSYVALHHLKSTMCRRRLIELIQANEGDEFLGYFPEYTDEYRKLQVLIHALCRGLETQYEQHKDLTIQKDFAMAVRDLPCSGAMFSTRNGKADSPTAWIMALPSKKLIKLINVEDDAAEIEDKRWG